MPRTIDITEWDEETTSVVDWVYSRLSVVFFTVDITSITVDSTLITADKDEIESAYDSNKMESTRYFSYFYSNLGQKVLNNSGKTILLNGINKSKNNTLWI